MDSERENLSNQEANSPAAESLVSTELPRSVQAGDQPSLEKLVGECFPAVYAIGYAHLRNRETAEDLAQEVFLRAYLNIGTLKEPSSFLPWLVRIARNLASNWSRNGMRASRLVQMVPMPEGAEEIADGAAPDAREVLSAKQQQLIVQRAVDQLPVQLREIVLLHYVEGMGKSAIGRALGMHDTSVGRHLARAHELLRKELDLVLAENLRPLAAHRPAVCKIVTCLTALALLEPAAKAAIASAAAETGFATLHSTSAGFLKGNLLPTLIRGGITLSKSKTVAGVAAGVLLAVSAATIYQIRQPGASGGAAVETRAGALSTARAGDSPDRSRRGGTSSSQESSTLSSKPFQEAVAASERSAFAKGIVVDENDRPIAGVSVRCARVGGSAPASAAAETTSSAAGTFELADLPPGRAVIVAETPAHVQAILPVNLPADSLRIRLKSTGAVVAGYVFSLESGAGVAGCEVSAVPASSLDIPAQLQRPRVTTTDAQGAFRIGSLAAGSYRLDARKGATLGLLPRVAPDTYVLSLKENETTGQLHLTVYGGHTVKGVVTDLNTSMPVAGATVWAGRNGARDVFAQSGEDGSFLLRHIFSENARAGIGLSKKGYSVNFVPFSVDDHLPVHLMPDQLVLTTNLELSRAISISGKVMSEDRSPVVGAKVSVYGRNDSKFRERYVETAEDGTYTVEAPANDNVLVFAEAEGKPSAWSSTVMVRNSPVTGVDIVLRAGARLEGRILKPDGQPAAGAKILSTQQAQIHYTGPGGGSGSFGGSPSGPETVADSAGKFALQLPTDVEIPVAATLAGYGSSKVVRVRLRDHEAKVVEWRLESAHFIGGKVTQPDGTPIAGASVSISSSDIMPGWQTATTDGSGRYRFSDLPDTMCEFSVNHPRFGWKHNAGKWPVDLDSVDFILGSKTFDLVGKVVAAGTDRVVPDFNVISHLPAQKEGQMPGHFVMKNLPAEGHYELRIEAPGYAPIDTTVKQPPPGVKQLEQVFEAAAGGRIVGRVLDRTTQAPLRGVQVLVERDQGFRIPPSPPLAAASSDEEGRFIVSNLAQADVVIRARTQQPVLTVTRKAKVRPGETSDIGTIEFGRGSAVTGRVVQMPGAMPVAGEKVRLLLGEIPVTEAVSDASGHVRFDQLDEGRYNLQIPDRGLSVECTLKADETKEVDLPIGGGSFRGKVLYGGRAVPATIQMALYGGRPVTREIRTDELGSFLAENLPGGEWSLTVSPNGPGFLRDKVLIPENQEVARDLIVPVHQLAGTVAGEDGQPVMGVKVTAFSTARGAGGQSPHAYSKRDGAFLIDYLNPGTYGVLATPPLGDGRAYAADIVIPEDGQAPSLNLRLADNTGSIVSTVYSMATGKPLPSAVCRVAGLTDNYTNPARDADGTTKIEKIPPGTYEVLVSAHNYTTARHTVEVKAGETVELKDVLSEAGSLLWAVKNADGAPEIGIPLTIEPLDPASLQETVKGTTSSAGNFYFGGLFPGLYRTTTGRPGQEPVIQQVQITPGKMRQHETILK